MRSTTRQLMMVAGVALATVAVPALAAAQHRLEPVRVVAADAAARAAALHAEGEHDAQMLDRMKRASRLHEQSAKLRAPDDPQLPACLREAALLRYYSGDRSGAVRLMEDAAARAADRGDVIVAAQSFSDAAVIAHELKQPARAWGLGVRADVLTSSPLLNDDQRTNLRERIVQLDRSTRVVSVGRASLPAAGTH